MKKYWAGLALFLVFTAGNVRAEMPADWKPPKQSAELQTMKGMAGEWTGQSQDHGEARPMTVRYEVTSGGSAVVETLDPGTSHEMVSIYHDKAGKLSMTHYCMLGNQPELELKKASDDELEFDLSAESQAQLGGQLHMHSLKLEMSRGTLTQSWTAQGQDGKMLEPTVFKLRKT